MNPARGLAFKWFGATAALLAGVGLLLLAVQPSVRSTVTEPWRHFGLAVVPAVALFFVAAALSGRPVRAWVLALAVVGVCGAALLHPVCDPIPKAQQPAFETVKSLEQRAAAGEPFRRLGGRWYQCKSYVSRAFFF